MQLIAWTSGTRLRVGFGLATLALMAASLARGAEITAADLSAQGERARATLTVSGEIGWASGDARVAGEWDLLYEIYAVDEEGRERLFQLAEVVVDPGGETMSFSISIDNQDRRFDEDKGGVGVRLDEIVARVRLRNFPAQGRARVVSTRWTPQVQGRF